MGTQLAGAIIIAVGLFFIVCGRTQSEFFLYRLLVARSRLLWGKHVYRFHQVVGAVLVAYGMVLLLGFG